MDTLGEIKVDELKIPVVTFLELYFVLSPSLYMLIQLFSLVSVSSGFENILLHASHVCECSATIHQIHR